MLAREAELNKKLKEVEAEKAKMQAEAEKEQKRLEEHEKEMQDKIKEWSRQYTGVVCYCFDSFSTLLYVL